MDRTANYSKAIQDLEAQTPTLKANGWTDLAKQNQNILNRLKERTKNKKREEKDNAKKKRKTEKATD